MRFFGVDGQLDTASTNKSGGLSIGEKDVEDKNRLASVIRDLNARVTRLEGNASPEASEYEVNVKGDGSSLTLEHNLGDNVRFSVVHWAPATQPSLQPQYIDRNVSWSPIDRVMDLPATWATGAGNFTLGNRWRINVPLPVLGIRFPSYYTAALNNVKVALWNDSTGAIIASGTLNTTAERGMYYGRFTNPVQTDLTGVDVIASVYDPTVFSYSTDVALIGQMPVRTPHMTIKHDRLYAAGDARPTLVGAGNSWHAEPVLDYSGFPVLVYDRTNSRRNRLVLKVYGGVGKAVIRIEASQSGVTL